MLNFQRELFVMIIDFHTHIFPGAVRSARENFFDNEPAFKLLYDMPKSSLVGVDDLVATMDEQGVDVSAVFGFPWINGDTARLNNDYILEAVGRYPDRLKGFACFDMSWDGAADEARRCIQAGLSGVGELAFYLSGIDETALEQLEEVMAVCRDAGNLPVMIHTNEPVGHYYPGKTPVTIEQVYGLARRYPDNRIVLAHWGGGILFYHLLKKNAKTVLKNIWYDTAASPFLYDADIYRVAVELGVIDKVLFGTDFPLLKPARYYKDFQASGISDKHRAMVSGENARQLLWPGE